MKKRRAAKPRPPEPGTHDHWQQSLSEKERRIEEIAAKMQQGAWLSGVSDRVLAQEWNCSPNTVRKFAAEASRLLRRLLRTDPEAQREALAEILQTFEVIRAKAMAKGDPASLRVALDATRARGFYLGIEPAKRLEVNERADPFEGWTVQEKLAYANDGTKPKRALRRVAELSEGNGADHDSDAMH